MRRVFALALVLVASPAAAQTGTTKVEGFGTAMVAPGGFLVGAGGEISARKWGLELAGDYFGYEYSEDGYYETGAGYLVNVRGRWYAQNEEQRGLWLAGGLALGVIDVYWREELGGGSVDYADETYPGVVANFGLGYKLRFAEDHLVVDPQMLLGVIAGTEGNPFVVGAGLNAGWRF